MCVIQLSALSQDCIVMGVYLVGRKLSCMVTYEKGVLECVDV